MSWLGISVVIQGRKRVKGTVEERKNVSFHWLASLSGSRQVGLLNIAAVDQKRKRDS